MKLVLASVFLILLLVTSGTIANFSAYGHYDPPTDKAETNVITIKNIQLSKSEKCVICGQDVVPSDITDVLLHTSLENEKHIGANKSVHVDFHIVKKDYAKRLERDHGLGNSNYFVYTTPSFEENKLNQKIWSHVDCADPELVTMDFALINQGNKPLQAITKIIQKIDSDNEKWDYINIVTKSLGLPLEVVSVPWIVVKLADIADWFNDDVLLGIGHEENVGPGTYKTEIVFPLTEDEKSTYDSRLKTFGQEQANQYLKSVLKIAGVVTWSYESSELKNDSGCKPQIPPLEIKNSTKVSKDDKEKIKKKPKYLPQKKSLKKIIDTKTNNAKKPIQIQPEVNSLKRTKDDRNQIFNTTQNILKKYTESPTSVLRGNDDGKVSSNTKPTLSLPKQIIQEATGPTGASVIFSASSQDKEDGALTPTCTPQSDSTFPIGTTTVSCTVMDSNQNSVSGSFSVIVRDTTPPTIDPIKPSEGTRDDSGIVIFYEATAHDAVDGTVSVQCNYPSGYKFPIGVTMLTCTADDSHGNHGSRSLQITVSKKETGQ